MKADAVVNVVNLTKKYGDVTVLDGLNLRVERGQTVALLGPNGAGKTTTVEIIRGLVPRNAGSVEVFGENPTNNSNPLWQARIGMTLQAQRDHAKWRVMEFLNWIRASYEGIRDCRDVSELIDSFDLGKHAYKTISTLSGGLRRRLDLAAALVTSPDLLILDEPTSGVDYRHLVDISEQLKTLAARGVVVIVISHDHEFLNHCADRIVHLNPLTGKE
jgi:ABC transporter, ATP-binding protein